jgi:predicted O-methyltransferase YrrM
MDPEGTPWAIDPYPTGRLGFSAQKLIATSEVRKVSNGTVEWVRKTGVEAGRDLARQNGHDFDFVFIDGDHTYEGLRADWESWNPLLQRDGIMALHDSRSTSERHIDDAGSVRFTRDVILPDRKFEVLELVDSLTVLRRVGD